MLKLFVPTPEPVELTAPVLAFTTATSTSGSENPEGMPASQVLGAGSPSSIQCVPSHCTITPTAGAAGGVEYFGGAGGGGPPPAWAGRGRTPGVWFPPAGAAR